jgi:hypothetical protein
MNEEAPQSAMSALRLMPSKAKEVASFSMQIIKAVENGDANPLEVLVMLRSLEAVSEMVREEIEDNILSEADRYSEKIIERFGARIEKCEVGTKYIYESSKDAEWEQMDSELRSLQFRMKEREKFLRSLTGPMTLVIESTGEVVQVNPPVKKSKTGVKVFLR